MEPVAIASTQKEDSNVRARQDSLAMPVSPAMTLTSAVWRNWPVLRQFAVAVPFVTIYPDRSVASARLDSRATRPSPVKVSVLVNLIASRLYSHC